MAAISLILNVFYVLVSAFIIWYAYPVLKNFKNLKSAAPWILIIVSYVCDLIGNIGWLNYYLFLGENNIPYQTWVDFFYLASYLLFGLAILLVWLRYARITKYKNFINNTILVLAILFAGGCFGYWLYTYEYFEFLVDVLYVVIPLFSIVAGIPLIVLTRGGELEQFWILVVISGVFFAFAESLWAYLYVIEADLLFADVFWILGYSFFIYAVYIYRKSVKV